ncbi:MAG: flagellar hook protein FlgE [Proteobacteria bacterium]|nr:flagellar hook protein FlgE [Pseudomonadota bacterium]
MPSIIDGLFAGRAGIQSQGSGISVLADNIANANTTGFKQSRADFSDILAGNIGGSGNKNSGSGSQVIGITPILTQGSLEFTGRGLDAAIDGNGYFVLQDSTGNGQRYYSRAGDFQVDTDGFLLNQNGYRVMGFPTNGSGGLEELNINQQSQASINTSDVAIGGNLNAGELVEAYPGDTATFSQLSDASKHSTFLDVYDTLGGSHTATVYFFKTAANVWTVATFVDGSEITSKTAGEAILIGKETFTFDSTGGLATTSPTTIPATADWANGSAAGAITFDLSEISQFASSSAINSITQDGTGSGSVVSFSIESNGALLAQLDNGQTSTIGTVALANFASAESLRRVGGSVFVETQNSGQPVVGNPDTGSFGAIESGALELSNADIASDFIKLISLQRGFQGSSRIITSINDLLSEIINLAR